MPRENVTVGEVLGAVRTLNEKGCATSTRIAQHLGAWQKTVHDLCMQLCENGYLDARAGKRRFAFTWYALTDKGATVIGRVA